MKYVVEPKNNHDPIRYFQEICAIPHGSGNEKAISEYLIDFAKEQGLWYTTDALYNVIITRDGRGKGADAQPIILQGHTDMVCEKNSGTDFDFEKDGLRLYVEDGWLRAEGTTLGADDGLAVAYMMSLLADMEADCPPLECIFTTQEETGLDGAKVLDVSMLRGKRMINLDAGPQGSFLVSSAGGIQTHLQKKVVREAVDGKGLCIAVKGLAGGHSGSDIDKEKGNANHLMARILYAVQEAQELRILSINGGDKDNAIPRECAAEIAVKDISAATEAVEVMHRTFAEELAGSDSGVSVEVKEIQAGGQALSAQDSRSLVELMFLLPTGPFHRNLELNNLVISSLNFASIHSFDDHIQINLSTRSAALSRQEEVIRRIELIARLFDLECAHFNGYPCWDYVPDSPLRALAVELYREKFGAEPEIEAIHGGLECGIFREKIPGLDILAMGPTHVNLHTPEESLLLRSFQEMYGFLKDLLAAMCG